AESFLVVAIWTQDRQLRPFRISARSLRIDYVAKIAHGFGFHESPADPHWQVWHHRYSADVSPKKSGLDRRLAMRQVIRRSTG
ncbi:MAG TPA: hypothetical protein VFB88_19240, partial [Xanthobacteraceae bacterium]|nr:hypothetical protein [Xanthobacteraceae bacterium]